MSNPSPVDVEAGIDQVPTNSKDRDPAQNPEDQSNTLDDDDGELYEQMFLDNDEKDAPKLNNYGPVNEESVPLPRKRKACFLVSYSSFLILGLVFILVVAYTYPLKPVCRIDNFSLASFDKESPNITEDMADSVSLNISFYNRNKLISVSYDDFLIITIYYLPDSNSSIYIAEGTHSGFYQHKVKPMSVVVKTHAPALPKLLAGLETGTAPMTFRVELLFSLRFHCRELGKHKHRFLMTADVEISSIPDEIPDDYYPIPMSEMSS